jgi:hypothetical protein
MSPKSAPLFQDSLIVKELMSTDIRYLIGGEEVQGELQNEQVAQREEVLKRRGR